MIAPTTTIRETDKDVCGIFDFGEGLSISTTSGNIDIRVRLGTKEKAFPGILCPSWQMTLESVSGLIVVRWVETSTADVASVAALSNLETYILSESGDITATLLHGSFTGIQTTSGKITVNLHPVPRVLNRLPPSEVQIGSLSGFINYALKSYNHRFSPIQHQIRQDKGQIKIILPKKWNPNMKCVLQNGDSTWDTTKKDVMVKLDNGIWCLYDQHKHTGRPVRSWCKLGTHEEKNGLLYKFYILPIHMSQFQPTQLDPSCVSINKTYQDVEGTFTLTNRLAITTTTGDINIELRLPPHISTRMLLEDGSQEEPPELCLTSIAGSITVITPDVDSVVPTPWSNLITTICTKNGDIKAAIPHGQITDIYNYQGDVVLNLHPIEPSTPQEPTHVVVKAYKGSLDFRVYEYNKDRKGVTSEIHQIAGPAKVIMPKAWNRTAVWQDMNKRGQPMGKRQKLIEEDGDFWRGHREEGGLAAGRVTWKGAAWILDFD